MHAFDDMWWLNYEDCLKLHLSSAEQECTNTSLCGQDASCASIDGVDTCFCSSGYYLSGYDCVGKFILSRGLQSGNSTQTAFTLFFFIDC